MDDAVNGVGYSCVQNGCVSDMQGNVLFYA